MKALIITLILLPTILCSQIYHRDPSGLTYTIDSFTTSGTWTKPAGVSRVYFFIIAGGGGGSGGRRGAASTNRGGGVGHNSGTLLVRFAASDLSTTETITIGAGGTGGLGATVNTTSGAVGGTGGNSLVRNTSFARVSGRIGAGGGIAVIAVLNNSSPSTVLRTVGEVINSVIISSATGTTTVASEAYRPNSAQNNFSWRGHASAGGGIRLTNEQTNSGGQAGFYNEVGTLTGAVASGKGEGLNGDVITTGYTIGNYIAQFLHWFDPADITSEMPRGGMGGGPGDTAGTIAGGNGEVGRGYGAAGGGGGAATNGANGGNGAAGNPGIIIAINVFE